MKYWQVAFSVVGALPLVLMVSACHTPVGPAQPAQLYHGARLPPTHVVRLRGASGPPTVRIHAIDEVARLPHGQSWGSAGVELMPGEYLVRYWITHREPGVNLVTGMNEIRLRGEPGRFYELRAARQGEGFVASMVDLSSPVPATQR